MSLVSGLRTLSMKFINKEFVRFLMVGFLNTLVTYLLYVGLLLFFSYNLAYSCAYVGGIVFSYYLNVLFVFKEKVSWKSFLRFPFIYILQYGCSIGMINVLVIYVGITQTMAPLIAIVVTVPITFLLSKLVIVKRII